MTVDELIGKLCRLDGDREVSFTVHIDGEVHDDIDRREIDGVWTGQDIEDDSQFITLRLESE